jgi:uncharacterized protein with HEPN domain
MTEDIQARYFTYIYDSIVLIEARTRFGQSTFFSDIDAQDAVLWRLQTLAEATAKLPGDFRKRHPSIPWRAIYGFRNVVAHGYLNLNLDRVWEVVAVHLPTLKEVVETELKRRA